MKKTNYKINLFINILKFLLIDYLLYLFRKNKYKLIEKNKIGEKKNIAERFFDTTTTIKNDRKL